MRAGSRVSVLSSFGQTLLPVGPFSNLCARETKCLDVVETASPPSSYGTLADPLTCSEFLVNQDAFSIIAPEKYAFIWCDVLRFVGTSKIFSVDGSFGPAVFFPQSPSLPTGLGAAGGGGGGAFNTFRAGGPGGNGGFNNSLNFNGSNGGSTVNAAGVPGGLGSASDWFSQAVNHPFWQFSTLGGNGGDGGGSATVIPLVPPAGGAGGAGFGGGGAGGFGETKASDAYFGGNGGSSAGPIVIVARQVTGNVGGLQARGGTGGSVLDFKTFLAGGGAGGGGGGGCIEVYAASYDGNIVPNVSGGAAGQSDLGQDGTAGTAGQAKIFQIKKDLSIVERTFSEFWQEE